jgi:hypothetical protein
MGYSPLSMEKNCSAIEKFTAFYGALWFFTTFTNPSPGADYV